MAALPFSIPLSFYSGSTGPTIAQVPWVDSLGVANSSIDFAVLEAATGDYPAGLYTQYNRRWVYTLPYAVAQQLVASSAVLSLYVDLIGTVSAAEGTIVYRNGSVFAGSTLNSDPVVWAVVSPPSGNGAPGSNGVNGIDGTNGTDGAAGTNGTGVLSGSGAPASDLGVDGDFYIDTAGLEIYGPKLDGSWGTGAAFGGGAASLPANATLRNIATRCCTPGFTNTGLTSLFSRTAHINRSDATTGFQPEFANWYATYQGEFAGYANYVILASLEYPKGTYTRLTFGGVSPHTIPASTNAIADACAAIVPIGARFWINSLVNCPSGIFTTNGPVSDTNQRVSGDQNLASATAIATDWTMQPYGGAGAMTSMNPPIAIWAMSSKESIIVYGDSRAAGLKDQQGGSFNGGYGGFGEITRGFDAYVAYCNVGCPTGTAAGFIAQHTQRAALKAAHTQVHYQYGINDLNAGTTAATLEGYATTIVGYFTGMKVSANTIPPQCTSTDGFLTQAAQTQFAGAAQRQLYNTYLRGTTHPFGVVYDISDIGEYHRGGTWLTPDVDPRIIAPITFEGTHWSPWGYLFLQKSGAVDGRIYEMG